MKKQIPNILTLGNLVCGCIACVMVLENQYNTAILLVGFGLIFDFLDGFVARMLHVSNRFGKELDSFADLITFGVVPSMFMFQLLKTIPSQFEYLPYFSFIIAAFSALRLAKFNLDMRQSNVFYGLPTPANAMMLISLFYIYNAQTSVFIMNRANAVFFVIVLLISSFLLVSELKLFALKFQDFTWKSNKVRYVFLAFSAVLLVAFNINAVPAIILIYIVFSMACNLFSWITWLD